MNKGNYKHGESKTRLHGVWKGIKDRCYNSNHVGYKNYGGRGITICPEWTDKLNGFINFRNWALNNGYAEGLQINRINNNGNYEPSNCNFITRVNNNRNQRKTKLSLEKANEIRGLYKTGNYTLKKLGIKFNVSFQSISFIVNNKTWI